MGESSDGGGVPRARSRSRAPFLWPYTRKREDWTEGKGTGGRSFRRRIHQALRDLSRQVLPCWSPQGCRTALLRRKLPLSSVPCGSGRSCYDWLHIRIAVWRARSGHSRSLSTSALGSNLGEGRLN